MNRKTEDIKNIHYNNKNEIQFEYGGQTHHLTMDDLKEIFIGYWNLFEENDNLRQEIRKLKEELFKLKTFNAPIDNFEKRINKVINYIEERKKYKGEPFYLDEIQTEILYETLKGEKNER